MSIGKNIGLVFSGLLFFCTVRGQSVSLLPATVSFGYSTLSDFRNAKSQALADQLRITGLITLNSGVTVQAAGNLTSSNGNNIPISNFTLTLTTIKNGGTTTTPNTQITLSASPQQISTGLNVSLGATLLYSFTWATPGGTAFLVPAGTYSTTVTFTSTALGIPVGNASATLTVTISDLAAITLQGGSGTAALSLTTAANYQNGVSLTQTNALNAFSNRSYKIGVQANSNLLNGLNSIPITNVRLAAIANPVTAGITTPQLSLGLSSQTLITSTIPTLSQNFNLVYSTTAGNTAFFGKPAGTYSTTVVYSITAP